MNYYNEHDTNAVAWLRELIAQRDIPDGYVDSRSIEAVRPEDIIGYHQCHFFAGIGGWPHAINLAGWGGPLWTASLPCQPFSQAGRQRGAADERHLWPVFRALVAQCRPVCVVGEQVASKAGRAWFAAVRADLEALGYAVGAADLCAAGVGAPHIRQRLYWCAVRLGHAEREPAGWHPGAGFEAQGGARVRAVRDLVGAPSATAGWSDAHYHHCRDGKDRPIPAKSSLFPLADGLSPILVRGCGEGVSENQIDPDATTEGRVIRLRGYGNAIIPELAVVFLESIRNCNQVRGLT